MSRLGKASLSARALNTNPTRQQGFPCSRFGLVRDCLANASGWCNSGLEIWKIALLGLESIQDVVALHAGIIVRNFLAEDRFCIVAGWDRFFAVYDFRDA